MKLNLTREEVVAALRCCAKDMDCAGNCAFFGLNSPSEDCSQRKNNAAADLIENQQREIEALRWANEGLRYNLDSWANLAKMAVRANRVVRPYEATTEKNGCSVTLGDRPDKQIEIVAEWAAAHPRKTRQDLFLGQWPDAQLSRAGDIIICPKQLCKGEELHELMAGCRGTNCDECRREFYGKAAE